MRSRRGGCKLRLLSARFGLVDWHPLTSSGQRRVPIFPNRLIAEALNQMRHFVGGPFVRDIKLGVAGVDVGQRHPFAGPSVTMRPRTV